MNLGLRYEFTTLPKDANNSIQEITTLVNCATPGVAPSLSSPCGPVHVGSFIANNPTTKNFEPRIGFSWDPVWKRKDSRARGVCACSTCCPFPTSSVSIRRQLLLFRSLELDQTQLLEAGMPDPNVSFNPNNIRNRYVQQNPKRALVLNWNFNVQREVAPNLDRHRGLCGIPLGSPRQSLPMTSILFRRS